VGPALGPATSRRAAFILLGLEVLLSRITLDVNALPVPGALLGNLLCAVAGLLDGVNLNALLQGVLTNLLTAINDILGGLLNA
jgi:hypothetical protein